MRGRAERPLACLLLAGRERLAQCIGNDSALRRHTGGCSATPVLRDGFRRELRLLGRRAGLARSDTGVDGCRWACHFRSPAGVLCQRFARKNLKVVRRASLALVGRARLVIGRRPVAIARAGFWAEPAFAFAEASSAPPSSPTSITVLGPLVARGPAGRPCWDLRRWAGMRGRRRRLGGGRRYVRRGGWSVRGSGRALAWGWLDGLRRGRSCCRCCRLPPGHLTCRACDRFSFGARALGLRAPNCCELRASF